MTSLSKELFTETKVSPSRRGYEGIFSGRLNENYMENPDEAHLTFNMDNRKTLGVREDTTEKYADIVSGGGAMTMVACISRRLEAIIHPPFLVFKNIDRIYPKRRIPDNVPEVSYLTGTKGCMYTEIFKE